jgi:hypothetical protein
MPLVFRFLVSSQSLFTASAIALPTPTLAIVEQVALVQVEPVFLPEPHPALLNLTISV